MKTCTKVFADIPFAHRAYNHDGHCALIHGHNWNIEITFYAEETDMNGFVLDFGKMGFLKDWIKAKFDHHLLLSKDDPLADHLERFFRANGIYNITEVPDCSCEGLAQYIYDEVGKLLPQNVGSQRGVRVLRVRLREDSKNSADYTR